MKSSEGENIQAELRGPQLGRCSDLDGGSLEVYLSDCAGERFQFVSKIGS